MHVEREKNRGSGEEQGEWKVPLEEYAGLMVLLAKDSNLGARSAVNAGHSLGHRHKQTFMAQEMDRK